MTVPVEVCLKGEDYASNESISGISREPKSWTDADVRLVLEGMLQALHRKKHPSSPDQPVALRGFSWIVNPYEAGGVVIAIEARQREAKDARKVGLEKRRECALVARQHRLHQYLVVGHFDSCCCTRVRRRHAHKSIARYAGAF